MPRGIQRARLDRNQAEIVEALRKVGISVLSLASVGNGCPDIICGHRGQNTLLEIKDGKKPPSGRRLTPDERNFHAVWRGNVFVVHTFDEAMDAIRQSLLVVD